MVDLGLCDLGHRPDRPEGQIGQKARRPKSQIGQIGLRCEVVFVDFGEARPFTRQVFFRKDCGYRTCVYAQGAVDAVCWIDVELRVGFVAVDAIHGADIDAGLVLNVDARFCDDVGH